MADILFDDLIPAKDGASSGTVSFNDLIPAEKPWYAKLGGAADDIARLVANGATFGYADKLAGYMGGEGTTAENAKTQAAKDRAGPYLGPGVEMGASILPMVGAAKAGLTAARLVPESLTGAGGLLARSGAAAVDGSAIGALSAAGHDQDIGTGAAVGALAGAAAQPVAEGLASVGGRVAGFFNKKPELDVSALKDTARSAYRDSEAAGVVVRPEGLQRLTADIKDKLAELGYHPQLQPKVGVALDELEKASQGNVTLKGLDVLRQIAGAAKTDADPSTRKVGGALVSEIDGYLNSLSAADVLTGNRTQGVQALQEARALWQTARKTELVNELVEKATNNAAAAGSGGNVDNALRQQFKTILNNPSTRRGFTTDEIDGIRQIVKGDAVQNTARLLGKLSPQGNGLMLMGSILSGTVAGPTGLLPGAVGTVAKNFGDKATQNNVYALARIIAAGGDASMVAVAKNAVERLSDTERDALARILTSWGVSSAAVAPQQPSQ